MSVTTYMDKTIVSLFAWVMVKFAVGPCQDVKAWLHRSWLFPELELEGAWGVNAGKPVGATIPGDSVAGVPIVGKGGTVSVGRGIGLAVSVGTAVLVGIAWRVCAAMVEAAATAVFWISTGFTVGAALGAQALTSKTSTTLTVICFIYKFTFD